MKITHEIHGEGTGFVQHPQTITIDLDVEDDPLDIIKGMVIRGRLATFLQVMAHPASVVETSDTELWETLVRFGYVAGLAETNLDELMWIAHDTAGISWRKLETAIEIPQATIRRRVDKVRKEHAENGHYRDASGLHKTDPDTALARITARAATD